MPLTEGTRLGRYRIGSLLGAGGMGEVYLGTDERLGRSVAVKVISDALSHDPTRQERFEREARAIAALNHPHICAIYDMGQHEGVSFIVMELLEGEPLSARLARGPLPRPEALAVAFTVLETLGALHGRGFVHRDLKPANIFLTPHGVKLLDFGLARSTAAEQVDATITQPGLMLGTPRYMAPEQVRGIATDHRSDLFSAGGGGVRDARRPAAVRWRIRHRRGARGRLRGACAVPCRRGAACGGPRAATCAREGAC